MNLHSSVASATIPTVLCIDDDQFNLELIACLATLSRGIALVTACSGKRGLEIAREQPMDLILLDLRLPDFTGEEVLARLRADAATVHVPVMVLSADAMPSRIDRIVAAGVQGYITKPIEISRMLQLFASVREHSFPLLLPSAA